MNPLLALLIRILGAALVVFAIYTVSYVEPAVGEAAPYVYNPPWVQDPGMYNFQCYFPCYRNT
jgi:hypothetical protein